MTFKIAFNNLTHIVECRVHAEFDWNLIEQMVPEISKLLTEANSNLIFIDFRRSKVTMSTIKIYETPQKIAEEFAKMGINAQKLRRAILINPNQQDFDFLESVTTNNAQILKLFNDEMLAMEWLKSFNAC